MPSDRTDITEITTGLATLGFPSIESAIRSRPGELANVDPAQWDRLERLAADPSHAPTFATAWDNGLAFAKARDGLRGRRPLLVEWKGPHGSPGDHPVPVDLRIDHVYLVSCKYFSRILFNVAPASLFVHGLVGRRTRSRADWYQVVAPREYQELYESVRDALALTALPVQADELTTRHRRVLKEQLRDGWPANASSAYSKLALQVSRSSASRWRELLRARADECSMLWRLLRIGSAPYFVLGASRSDNLRIRVATPWDWQQRFELKRFVVAEEVAGQPVVAWRALVRDRTRDAEVSIEGHVEIRWSHGRFAQTPEAKVYLDSPHHLVPGYLPLA